MRTIEETRQPVRRARTAPRAQEAPQTQVPNSALLGRSEAALEALPSTRKQLPTEVEQQLEARFGVPLRGLKVFEDEQLGELGQSAYARGNEIHIAKGRYRPDSEAGRQLLMHEAGHIVQQGAGLAHGGGILESGQLESQADAGFAAPQSFTMPSTAQGMPIQGGDKWDKFKKAVGGAGTKVGNAVGGAVSKVGNAIADPFRSLGRKSNRNVDQFMDHRADFDKMSRWDRFKYTVTNPLTRMRAASKGAQEARDKRKAHDDRVNAAAQELATKKGGYANKLGDAAFDPLAEIGGGTGPGSNSGANFTGFTGTTKTMNDDVLGGIPKTAVSLGGTGVEKLGGFVGNSPGDLVKQINKAKEAAELAKTADEKKTALEEVTRLEGSLTKGDRAFAGVGGALQGIGGLMGAANNAMTGVSNWKKGNRGEAIANAFEMGGSLLGSASGFTKMGHAAKGASAALDLAGGKLMPGLELAQGIMQIGSGGIRTGIGARGLHHMNKRGKELDKKGVLTEEETRKRKILGQFGRVAKRDTVGGAMELGSGILKTTGAALSLGGVSAPAGAILGGIGTGVDIIKGIVTGKMDKSNRTKTVNEELGLEQEIADYKRDNPGVSDKDAKHTVLKAMGFATGKRKEAFEHIAMSRAHSMVESANGGDEESAQILNEVGLSRVKGQYSLQGVAEKLGMDRDKSWRDQMQETIDSRANKNIFKERNDEKAAKKQQKLEKAQEKAQKKQERDQKKADAKKKKADEKAERIKSRKAAEDLKKKTQATKKLATKKP